MRKLLMTSALVMPLAMGTAFAQEAQEAQQDQETITVEGDAQVVETENDADQAAEAAGDAAEGAVEATGDAIEGAAEATGDAVEGAAEAVGDAAQGAEQAVEGEIAEEQAEDRAEEAAEGQGEMAEEQAEEQAEAAAEGEPAMSAEAEQVVVREQAPNELRVDWITGATVMSPDGELIGDVNDLILDGETGQLSAAIIGVGGFLGMGEKQIAVGWGDMKIDYDANEITLNLTKEDAEAAPEYVFREQEQAPAEAGGMGGDAGGGMATGAGGGMTADPGMAPAPAEGETAPAGGN